MQKRVKEIQERNKDNPAKLQEEMSAVYKDLAIRWLGVFQCWCKPVLLPCLPPARFTVFGCKLHSTCKFSPLHK